MNGRSKRRESGRFKKYGLAALGILILLPAIVLILATLPPGEGIIKGILEGQLSGLINQRLSIGGLETNLISRISLRDMEILPAAAGRGGIRIGSVEIRYSLTPLLDKTIHITSLEIHSLEITAIRDTAGDFNLNLPDNLTSGAGDDNDVNGQNDSEEGWRVEFDSILTEQMDICYTDHTIPMSTRLDSISVMVNRTGVSGLSFTLNTGSGEIEYDGVHRIPVSLTGRGGWENSIITFDTTRLILGKLDILTSGTLDLTGDYPLDFRMLIRGEPSPLPAIASGLFRLPDLSTRGDLGAVADIRGTLSNPLGGIRAELPEINITGISLRNGLISARRTPDTLAVDTLRAGLLGGSITAGGYLLAGDEITGHAALSLQSLQLERAWSAVYDTVSPYGGMISGDIRAEFSGTDWRRWNVNAGLEAESFSYLSRPSGNLILSLELKDRHLEAGVDQEHLSLSGDISFSDTSLQGNVSAAAGKLELLGGIPGLPELGGSITVRAGIGGTPASPSIRARFEANNPSCATISADSLSGQVVFDEPLISLDSLCFHRDSILVKTDGSFSRADKKGSLDVALYQLPLEKGKKITGGDTIRIRKSPGYIPTGYLSADFGLPGGGDFSLDASTTGLNLNILDAILGDTLSLGGTAELDITAFRTADSLSASVHLEASHPAYRGVQLDSLYLDGLLARGIIQVRRFGLYHPDQYIHGCVSLEPAAGPSGFPEVSGNTPTSGNLEASEFQLAILEPLLPRGTLINGPVWIDLEWNGKLSAPGITGTMRTDSVSLVRPPEEFLREITGINIMAEVRDSTLVLDSSSARIDGIPVLLEGNFSLVSENSIRFGLTAGTGTLSTISGRGLISPGMLDITTRADSLDLAVIASLIPAPDIRKGYLTLDASLKGPPGSPEIRGDLRAEGLEIQPPHIDKPITQGNLLARFSGDTIRVDTLSGRMGRGSFKGSGMLSADTTGIRDLSLKLTARDIGFTVAQHLTLELDSLNASWERENDYYRLSGLIDLGETRYIRNFQPAEILPWTGRAEKVEKGLPTLLARTRLEVNIAGDSIWIDNNLANLHIDSDLQLGGFLARPGISGRLKIEEGYILYLDRKFNVTEGVAFFTGTEGINPEVTLGASTTVTTYRQTEKFEYDIGLSVTGRLREPAIRLTSRPPLSRPDIVSVLTLGATRAELAGKTTRTLRERGEVLASGQISGFVGQRLGETLGLDQVTVRGNIFDLSGSSGPELILAKNVFEDVTVTYQTTVGHLNEQRIRANWQLSKHWMIQSTTSRNRQSSVSFTYSLRFR